MKKLIMALAVAMALPLMLMADDWKAYISYHNVTKTLPVGNKVYTLGSGGLFSYTLGDKRVRTYSKSTGLSSSNITHMVYCEELKELLLVYEDFNIDILGTNDSIINIPQYKNSSFSDKTINDITIMGHEAFLSTNFGVVIINLKRAEYTNAYELNMKVRSAVGDDAQIYVLGSKGIFTGDRKKNLLEASTWQQRSTFYPVKLLTYNSDIYALVSDGLYSFDTENIKFKRIQAGKFNYYSQYGRDLVLCNTEQVVVMNENEEFATVNAPNDFVYLSSDGTNLWAARRTKGLQAFTISNDTLKEASGSIIPNSPIRNYFSEMTFTPDNRLLIAGGALAYSGKTTYEGTAMMLKDDMWYSFEEDSIQNKTGVIYRNITSLAEDPRDANHHFATSATGGLYEFRNLRFDSLYNCDNSPITSIRPKDTNYLQYNRLCGGKFDNDNNLWVFNNQTDTIVRVLTADKKWQAFYFEQIKGYPTFDHYIFDNRGWVWMTHRRWAGTFMAGLACLNHNGTLNSKADDKFTFCTTFINQNGTTASISLLYDAVFDRNGQMWIGTDQGIYILEDPTKIFSGNVVFKQPVIPRNDGTNYADYLLEGVPVRTIAVDGANRKWIGTTNNGVYLVSEDGLNIISHFTESNSPLISDNILSLAINPENGVVMIGTDNGLMSFKGDATEPAETLKESNIKVFPNPVRPEYEGNVRITGFTADSDVKITTTNGVVVAQGQSLGGTFVWNGRDSRGNKVSTGIYHVIASDAEAKNGVVAKILFVK